MSMERLDGFTADGKGGVVSGDPQDGDVVRIDGKIEQRYYAPQPDPMPAPNNAGNPYFPGWRPKTQLGFWGLVQGVFIALGGSNEAGADRFARLVSDTRARGIVEMIRATAEVDPDDVNGAFLKALHFLTTTKAAADSQPLMTTAEAAAIMQKNNWA